MSSPQQGQEDSDWKKVGPCLYRYKGRAYYALLKYRGKQIRRSLETDDLALARRRLKDLRNDLEVTDPTLADRTLATNAEKFTSSLTGAASTVDNSRRSIKKLLEAWTGPKVISKIKKSDCDAWLAKYGDLSAAN